MRDPDLTKLFMETFHNNLSKHRTVRGAYLHTEHAWKISFGAYFYKNYESFRSAKSHYLSKQRDEVRDNSC